MPGGRMNPRQMKQAMKKLGIKTEEIEDAEEVVIRTSTSEYVISDPAVTMMEVQGQVTFQILGDYEIRERSDVEAGPIIPEEDITLVMEQAGCTREQAIEALTSCDGQPAEAILKIVSS
ncbi:MAG: nascent polypeptide-associated complex protein [Methanomassiliicoccales archaeon]|nr:nascent polypeptide-associated complex protein [Methanomassiliicoccales archaeon]NYT15657.1 nascent polypeptide-associated complex protein [Methanomassiliicoccales archaeon]